MAESNYNKIATILLKQRRPISIEKLSLKSNISIKETEEIVDFFNENGVLEIKSGNSFNNNFTTIELNDRAREII
jgi:hypothetical protein